ncbi:golgin subfamily A member 6-like protein 22 isoform X4 [Macrosteles quadrilineatus]|uniref:golgin subfamily A member 6-like protein 22 isoform X4 n=1 Tax=Macrosteles quadrilineatus TaxID=74068 RepID=UPI0023E2E54B|nr:golgin subfamily A member 6-like protein 22 isoform X4 [Macrosteles quadrilineatus]
MPPEQQTEISPESVIRRDSLASRRESLYSRRESSYSRRESIYSRRESLKASFESEDKILENGLTVEEGLQDEAEIPEAIPEPEPEPEPLSPEEEKRLREEEEQIRKKIAIEMRKAELRAKMEEASKARRAKKGFMTPERKKKLRLLLRRKAAEELRKEQERKANERRWIIEERCGEPEDLEWASKDDLIDICEDYFQRIIEIESDKWDLEYEIRKQTFEIGELTQKVSDLRGKFQRPVLKKVSKYENKFAKLQRKAAEYNFRSQLKIVRRPDYKPKEEDKFHGIKTTEEIEHFEKIEDTEEKEEKDTDDEVTESADRTSLKSIKSIRSLNEEEAVDKPKLEEEIKISEGDAEIEDYIKKVYTGRADSGEMSRLEGGEEEIPEGEMREGGQSPDQGEVQPSELSEGSEPPPPQPQHTPDDLWDYLKESVTGDHPATVEEFVQKLIGTLEHVPEEYLKPVIDYNIKRATSPSVTDGEHLDAKEGDHHEGEGQVSVGAGEAGAEGSGETEVLAGDEEQSSTLQESPVAEGELSEDPPIFHEDPTNITEEPTEGYTALEDAD